MFIKVTRSAAIAALKRGEMVWAANQLEGRQFCAPEAVSKRHARRFLSRLQRWEPSVWGQGFYLFR